MKPRCSDDPAPGPADVSLRIRRVFVRALALNLAVDDPALMVDLGSVAGQDSLSMLEFVAELEKEFQCRIEPDRLTLAFLGDLQALTEYFTAHRRTGGT